MIKSSVISFLFLSVFLNTVKAQVFWSEGFNNGCTSKCKPDTYTNPQGKVWKVNTLSAEGADANDWFISCQEEGKSGDCQGSPCTKNNSTLHISANTGPGIDNGAIYTKGAAGKTDKRAESPTIDCSGKTGINLKFYYICAGDSAAAGPHTDHCDLEYSVDDGATWKILQSNLTSYSCTGSKAMWRLFDMNLPADANNKSTLKVGFHWQNSSTTGFDPAFAVDSVHLSTSSGITTGTIPGLAFCACSVVQIPFTSAGTFNAGNIYTAELSDATGSFANPVPIGTLSSVANTGTINALIPCNTPFGTAYRIRVKSSDPALIGTDNGVNLTIGTPITVVITPRPDSVCYGQVITLKANGGDPGNYQWTTDIKNPVPTTADSISITIIKDTTIAVLGTKAGCIDTNTVKIKVQPPLNVTVTNDTTCVGLTAVIKATGGTQYVWNTGSTLDSIIVSPVKDTFYVVTVTKGNCTIKDTGYVKVFPTITITVNSATICAGQDTILTANGGLTYLWSTGEKTKSITVRPAVTTTYTVTGTAGACKDEAIATVTVKPSPDVKVETPKSVCQGKSVFLTATGATTYYWLTPPNNNTDTITLKPPFSTTVKVVGILNGCIDTASVLVTIDQRPNVVVNNPTICQGGTAVLVATGATTYFWPALNQSTDSVFVNPMSDMNYTVYGFNGDCADTAYATVIVGLPVTVNATSPVTQIFSCESTQLFADPTDGTYNWSTVGGGGDGSIDCQSCPVTTVTPLTTQAYYITYTSPKGCIGRDTILITVIKTNSYFIPTGFSPNDDGINDVVQVHGRGIDHISLMIFDRIGEKVFETHELESGWDGKLFGVPMNDNVFIYKLEVYYCDGEVVKENGNITLLK